VGSIDQHAKQRLREVRARRLLVVEDEPALRELFAMTLSSEGLVDVAADGLEALARLAEQRYDLILTDVDMPRLGGIGLFEKAVARHPELAKSFMFMTGGLSFENAQFFNDDEGTRPLVLKPVPVDELVSFVHRRLGEMTERPQPRRPAEARASRPRV
jgi:CheY-like chemotaxis protein